MFHLFTVGISIPSKSIEVIEKMKLSKSIKPEFCPDLFTDIFTSIEDKPTEGFDHHTCTPHQPNLCKTTCTILENGETHPVGRFLPDVYHKKQPFYLFS